MALAKCYITSKSAANLCKIKVLKDKGFQQNPFTKLTCSKMKFPQHHSKMV